jgi:hypothetical protein
VDSFRLEIALDSGGLLWHIPSPSLTAKLVSESPPDGGTIREDAMRKGTVLGAAVVLSLGLGTGLAVGQEPATTGNQPGFLARLFAKKTDPPKTAPALPKGPAADAESKAASAAGSAQAVQAREREALFRRQAVCDKLRLIAAQTSNDALMRKADQLNDRAWALYQQRTEASAVQAEGMHTDLDALNRHLGSSAPSSAAPPNLALRPLDSDAGRTAARREP